MGVERGRMAWCHIKVGGLAYYWSVGTRGNKIFALRCVAMKIAEIVVIGILLQPSSGQG